MKYKVWSGIETLGTNIVEIRSDKARLITDLGISFRGHDSFELLPDESLVEGRMRIGIIPEIENLFENPNVQATQSSTSPLPTAVLLSHLHLDHSGLLPYLPPETPVFLHEDSLQLYRALARYQVGFRQAHEFRPMKSGITVEFHDFKITFELSDHDIMGASAIFIEHDNKLLIHSGDMRLHGRNPKRVKALAKKANQLGTDVLFIEGSSYAWSDDPLFPTEFIENDTRAMAESSDNPNEFIYCDSEADLDKKFGEILESKMSNSLNSGTTNTHQVAAQPAGTAIINPQASQSAGLIAINPYIANVERLYSLLNIAKKHGRTFVWERPAASVLKAFYPDTPLHILDLEEKPTFFLQGQGGPMNPADTLAAEEYGPELTAEACDPGLSEDCGVALAGNRGIGLQESSNISWVTPEEILAHPEAYILQNSFNQLSRLLQFRPILYIHSNGTPLGAISPDYTILRDTLADIGCEYRGLACNGHLITEDIPRVIEWISPTIVHPWHTSRIEYMSYCLASRGFPVKPLTQDEVYFF